MVELLLLACVGGDPDLARMEVALARPPQQVALLEQDLAAIGDPVVRDAALTEWLRLHPGALPTPQAMRLCGLLDGASRQACERQVSSPHLQAPR